MLKVNNLIGFGAGGTSANNNRAVALDGTDYGELEGAELSGVTDGKQGTLSVWTKMTGRDGGHMYLWSMATGVGEPHGFLLYRQDALNANMTCIGIIGPARLREFGLL